MPEHSLCNRIICKALPHHETAYQREHQLYEMPRKKHRHHPKQTKQHYVLNLYFNVLTLYQSKNIEDF